VYVDGDGILRTTHELDLWAIRVLRLHYRLDPRSATRKAVARDRAPRAS
jgi:hypothetical protein